jgi:YfiH family protein
LKADFMPADWPAPKGVLAGTTLRGSRYELPAKARLLKQVHGARVVNLHSAAFDDGPPEADAVIAHNTGDMCVVQTADCLPVLLCGVDGREIAAIHAGWRGLSAGIIEETVGRMRTVPSNLIAWLGPGISQPNFEVGDEVREAFLAYGPAADAAFERNDRGRWQADLYKLARQHLGRTGVFNVSGGDWCTYADAEHFHSYRRDGDKAGRMLSFVYLRL